MPDAGGTTVDAVKDWLDVRGLTDKEDIKAAFEEQTGKIRNVFDRTTGHVKALKGGGK